MTTENDTLPKLSQPLSKLSGDWAKTTDASHLNN
jgi:hypothetical protein